MFTAIEYPPPLLEYDPDVPADPANPTKPRDNPLGNPLIYFVTTPRANDYRSLMFDTPEEVQDAVQYQAHMDTCKALDPNFKVEPTLGGQLTTPQSKHTVPTNLPLIDYLVRADYYGKYDDVKFGDETGPLPDSNMLLGGTKFKVIDLVDSLSQPTLTIGENPPSPIFESMGVSSSGGRGGGGGSSGTPPGATNRFSVVQSVASKIGYPKPGRTSDSHRREDVNELTQAVAERLHAEDPRWGRRINITGPLGKDTVAYEASDGRPYSIDIVYGSMSANPPKIHWDVHGFVGGTWVAPDGSRGSRSGSSRGAGSGSWANNSVDSAATDALNPDDITWHHGNGNEVANWRITSRITSTSFSATKTCLKHTMRSTWPEGTDFGTPTAINANPWVIANINGKWHAATWEWLRFGNQNICKSIGKSFSSHIKIDIFNNWTPGQGEKIYWMVSTPARAAGRSLNERSNIVLGTWTD